MVIAKKRKKLSNAARIRQYMKEHPAAKPREIAEALKVKVENVYVERNKVKSKEQAKAKTVTLTLPKNTESTVETTIEKQLKVIDNVNHPAHYKVGGVETIDFIEAKQLGYNLGNVIKYVSRSSHKGNVYEDLCKARWYLNREISKYLGVNNQ